MSNLIEVKFEKSKPKPDPAIIKMLERWLEEAKSGEVVAIGICAANSEGCQKTEFNSGCASQSLTLQSAVTTLFFRIGARIASE